MTTVARSVTEQQQQVWADYADSIRGLEGAEYDRAEAAAWEQLQRSLRALGVRAVAADDRGV